MKASRALRDAWPLIEGADELTIVTLQPREVTRPDPDLERHLGAHACKAHMIVDDRSDLEASDRLREHIEAVRADVLVMGLYGTPRLQETVLGGLSRDFLTNPPTPLFLSH